jgi:hypothetical protein
MLRVAQGGPRTATFKVSKCQWSPCNSWPVFTLPVWHKPRGGVWPVVNTAPVGLVGCWPGKAGLRRGLGVNPSLGRGPGPAAEAAHWQSEPVATIRFQQT